MRIKTKMYRKQMLKNKTDADFLFKIFGTKQ